MLSNYMKMTYRNLVKNKTYTSINIFSLAIGLASSMFLLVFIQDELSYDKHYKNAKNMYRIQTYANGALNNAGQVPFGKLFNEENNDIISTRVFRIYGVDLKLKAQTLNYKYIDVSDANLPEVYELDFISGNRASFDGPNHVIISESIAKRFFNGQVGESIETFGKSFIVTGIFKDFPKNSHVHFEFLFNMSAIGNLGENPWEIYRPNTFVRVKNGLTEADLNQRLTQFTKKFVTPRKGTPHDFKYVPQAITDIHLSGNTPRDFENNASINRIYTMSGISFMILLIACINFMNLATARAGKRAKEVGLRKTLGASKSELVRQFLAESLFITFLAFTLALLLVELLLPVFNQYVFKSFETVLSFPADVYFLLGILYLVVGIGAGLYPAFYLSKFDPVDVLKGVNSTKSKGLLIRKCLVICQFSISTILMIYAIVLVAQTNYLKNKPLGYTNTNLFTVDLWHNYSPRQQAEMFKSKLLENRSISEVSLLRTRPSDFSFTDRFWLPDAPENEYHDINSHHADVDFLKTYQIQLLKGRAYSNDLQTDVSSSVILNETAVKQFGIESDPIGKIIYNNVENNQDRATFNSTNTERAKRIPLTVIGVVKDYHHTSPRNKIHPLVIFLTHQDAPARFVVFRSEDERSIRYAEKLFHEIYPNREYHFRRSDQEYHYSDMEQESDLLNFFSFIGILLSCAGLFGLVSYTAEQKTKEIGIRKVLGANGGQITMVFIKEFGILILIANLLAFPIGFYFVEDWLSSFPYRLELTGYPFLLAGIFSGCVTALTIAYQVHKSSIEDPIVALRYE